MAENENGDRQADPGEEVLRELDFDVEVSVGVRFPEDADSAERIRELMRFRGALVSAQQVMTGGVSDLMSAGEMSGRMRTALSVWTTGGFMVIETALSSIDDLLVSMGMPTVSLFDVDSSNVAAMGWADPRGPEPAVAVVEFVGGSLYAYEGVPEDVFRNWWYSDSQGVYLNTHIKGAYEFRRLV